MSPCCVVEALFKSSKQAHNCTTAVSIRRAKHFTEINFFASIPGLGKLRFNFWWVGELLQLKLLMILGNVVARRSQPVTFYEVGGLLPDHH